MSLKALYFKQGIKNGRMSEKQGTITFKNRYKVIGIKYEEFKDL